MGDAWKGTTEAAIYRGASSRVPVGALRPISPSFLRHLYLSNRLPPGQTGWLTSQRLQRKSIILERNKRLPFFCAQMWFSIINDWYIGVAFLANTESGLEYFGRQDQIATNTMIF